MKIKNKYFAVFLATIIVRLIIAVLFVKEWPAGSSIAYRTGLAESIASGNGFSYNNFPNLYQTPVYPFFLALIFSTLGYYWWSIALIQSLLEGISSIFISKIGNKFSKFGWLAGLGYALYPYAIFQSRSIIDTSLFVFLFIMTIYCFLKFMERYNINYLVLASLFLGIGFLNRPSIIVIGPAFVLFMFVRKTNWKMILRFTLISVFISSLIPFAWILRNYNLTKKFPVLSVGGQHFMWHAHNRHVYDVLKNDESPDIIGRDPRYPMNPAIKVSDFFKISPSGQISLSDKCENAVKKWISNNKSEVMKYTILKLKMFLSWDYYPKNPKVPLIKLRILIYRLTNAPITIIGWIGLFLLFLKKRDFAVFIATISVGFVFIHVITIFVNRHKIPLDALFITIIPFTIHYFYLTVGKIGKRYVKK